MQLTQITEKMDGAIFQLQTMLSIVGKTPGGPEIVEAMKPSVDCLFECLERLMDEGEQGTTHQESV